MLYLCRRQKAWRQNCWPVTQIRIGRWAEFQCAAVGDERPCLLFCPETAVTQQCVAPQSGVSESPERNADRGTIWRREREIQTHYSKLWPLRVSLQIHLFTNTGSGCHRRSWCCQSDEREGAVQFIKICKDIFHSSPNPKALLYSNNTDFQSVSCLLMISYNRVLLPFSLFRLFILFER